MRNESAYSVNLGQLEVPTMEDDMYDEFLLESLFEEELEEELEDDGYVFGLPFLTQSEDWVSNDEVDDVELPF